MGLCHTNRVFNQWTTSHKPTKSRKRSFKSKKTPQTDANTSSIRASQIKIPKAPLAVSNSHKMPKVLTTRSQCSLFKTIMLTKQASITLFKSKDLQTLNARCQIQPLQRWIKALWPPKTPIHTLTHTRKAIQTNIPLSTLVTAPLRQLTRWASPIKYREARLYSYSNSYSNRPTSRPTSNITAWLCPRIKLTHWANLTCTTMGCLCRWTTMVIYRIVPSTSAICISLRSQLITNSIQIQIKFQHRQAKGATTRTAPRQS